MQKVSKKQYILYTYNISKLDKSKRVRFVYLLKGRREDKGLVEELNGKFLAPGCFIIPISEEKEINQIFKEWKVKNKREKIQFM
jgi:hypothetical protein